MATKTKEAAPKAKSPAVRARVAEKSPSPELRRVPETARVSRVATAGQSPIMRARLMRMSLGPTHIARMSGDGICEPKMDSGRALDCHPKYCHAPVQIQRAPITVSSPSDPAEREAVRAADKVMRMPEPAAPKPVIQRVPVIGRIAASLAQRSETIARKKAGRGKAGSDVVAEIKASEAGGMPLDAKLRGFMEIRFGADFSKIRLHVGEKAAKLCRKVGARAFAIGHQVFFGKGQYQPDSREGRELIAHELAHTIQQGAAVQHAKAPSAAKQPPAVSRAAVQERTDKQVSRWGIGDALDYFANKANNIPGFRMFTFVLGVNPINMTAVERSPANLIRAVIEMVPGGGLITQALDTYGVIDKAGGWISQQLATLGMTGASIKAAVSKFLDSLSWSDILDLGGVWERAKRIFTEPIERIKNFVISLVNGIIDFIKDAILRPLAGLASKTRGWDLLIAVLGKNPITGDPVPRTAETLIGGFMKLIGQEEVWENMKKANAIPRAWAWFQTALAGLMGFVQQIPTIFMNAVKSLTITDIIVLPVAFAKVAMAFGDFLGKFIVWAGETVWKLLEIIFDSVSPGAWGYIKKTGAALRGILKNPIPFVLNLVKAAKLGFENFLSNILTHLKSGLIDWLTGSMPGVYIPKSFALGEIVKFVFSVLGISWANIRQKLVKVVGEPVVKALETGFKIVVTLVTEGPAAAWELIKQELSNLGSMIIDGIIDFVVSTIVQKAVPKLIAMFIPGAGFISAIISIYDTIMVFVEKISKIIQVVKAFIDGIVQIAAGNIAPAAKRVESTLAGLLSLAISFLMGFIGLGKVADKLMGVIKKVQGMVDKGIDKLIDWIVAQAKKLFAKLFGKKDERTPEQQQADLDKAINEAEAVRAKPNITEAEIRKALPAIKKKYKLTSLDLVVDAQDGSSETIHIEADINPKKSGKQGKIGKDNKPTVDHQTGSLGGDVVGISMTADWLGPDHPAGSPPSSGAQPKLFGPDGFLVTEPTERSPDKFIRGHLLNENLGGPGVDKNLFPFTSNANSQHLHSTETDIKNWVNVSKKYAWYDVRIQSISHNLTAGSKSPDNWVNCTIACHYILKEKTGEVKKDVTTSISSTYKVKGKATKTDNLE